MPTKMGSQSQNQCVEMFVVNDSGRATLLGLENQLGGRVELAGREVGC